MEPSGAKLDLLAPAAASTAPLAAPAWSAKEKDERSEWFLVAAFIGACGFGILGIGVFGLKYWVSPGPDKIVDIFVCTMAILLGLLFLGTTAGGVVWLLRKKPQGLPQPASPIAAAEHENPA